MPLVDRGSHQLDRGTWGIWEVALISCCTQDVERGGVNTIDFLLSFIMKKQKNQKQKQLWCQGEEDGVSERQQSVWKGGGAKIVSEACLAQGSIWARGRRRSLPCEAGCHRHPSWCRHHDFHQAPPLTERRDREINRQTERQRELRVRVQILGHDLILGAGKPQPRSLKILGWKFTRSALFFADLWSSPPTIHLKHWVSVAAVNPGHAQRFIQTDSVSGTKGRRSPSSSGRYLLSMASLIWLLAPLGSRSMAQLKFIRAKWVWPSFL